MLGINRIKSIKRKHIIFLALGALAIMLIVAIISSSISPDIVDNIEVVQVTKGNVSKTVEGHGTIEAIEKYEITSLVNGDVLEDYFEEGQMVNEGDLLYLLDSSELDFNIKKAEADLEKAKNTYTKYLETTSFIVPELLQNDYYKIEEYIKVCDKLSEYERNYVITLYNVILGGGSDSKLFKEVREENSLCYSIYSVPNKLDHVIIIQAGIDKNNYDKTVKLIEKDLEDMRKGKFSEADISVAKEYFYTALEELQESPDRIINDYLMMELLGTDEINVKRLMIDKVTKEEIVKVAKKVKLDTIFLLEGVKDERN